MSIEDGKVVVVWMLTRVCVCGKASELGKITRELWRSAALRYKHTLKLYYDGVFLFVCPVFAFVTICLKNSCYRTNLCREIFSKPEALRIFDTLT